VDDLNLFAKNDRDLQRLLDVVETFSNSIRMSFGISKYAKLTIERGKVVQTGPLLLTNHQEIPELDPSGYYHYFEDGCVDHQNCKEAILVEYRFCLVWRSFLYGHYKVQFSVCHCCPTVLVWLNGLLGIE